MPPVFNGTITLIKDFAQRNKMIFAFKDSSRNWEIHLTIEFRVDAMKESLTVGGPTNNEFNQERLLQNDCRRIFILFFCSFCVRIFIKNTLNSINNNDIQTWSIFAVINQQKLWNFSHVLCCWIHFSTYFNFFKFFYLPW